jgi:hypothetical protein
MACLFQLLQQFLVFGNMLQFGARKGWQCTELIHVLRIILEKCHLWGWSCIIVSLDLMKAYDRLRLTSILRLLFRYNVPIRMMYALLKEILSIKLVTFSMFGMPIGPIPVFRGLRQGSPESSFLFALVVGDALAELDAIWRTRGLGVNLGKFGGNSIAFGTFWKEYSALFCNFPDIENIHCSDLGFLDDIYLVASCLADAQVMTNDVILFFSRLGLSLNPEKIKWIANNHVQIVPDQTLLVDGVLIPKSDRITCLGSVICGNVAEGPAFEHRISKAWSCYHKWSHMLESRVPLDKRLHFWSTTVLPSLVWGLQTTRSQDSTSPFQKLLTCQKLQIRRMMKCKRQKLSEKGPMEPWLDYHIRSHRNAQQVIDNSGINVHSKLHDLKRSWAGHVARFGMNDKEPHQLKALLAWRCSAWWSHQVRFNELNWDPIKNVAQQAVPKRWESQFSSNWMLTLLAASVIFCV